MTGAHPPGTGFAIEKAVALVAASVAAFIALVHGTGWLLARATGHPAPSVDIAHATLVLRGRPYVPGTPVAVHLALLALAVIALAFSVFRVLRWRHSRRARPTARANAFDGMPGWASPAAVRRTASPRELVQAAPTLRPGLADPTPDKLGYLLGTSKGQPVWMSCERSLLVVGPPGSGKGLHIAINAILDAPGPVITTSTKPDNLKATLLARAAYGPVFVFDPQGMLGADFAHLGAWDPVDGCEDPMRAATRADALAANTGIGDASENRIWRQHAKTVLETVLHAAALQGETIDTAYIWMQSQHSLRKAHSILEDHSDACPTWDERLRGIIDNPDPRFVGSVMSVVAAAVSPLALPVVRDALTPTPSRPAFTAETLLATSGTLYALATDRGAAAASGLVSALIEDVAYVARRIAARSPGGRMDPPVLFLLDECANVAPIPSLPALLADGRGQNLTVIPIFQALAQVRSRYGDDDASTVFSASQLKLILGGTDDADDLRDLSSLVGERDDWYSTTNRSAHALAFDSNASTSTSLRKVPVLPPDAIRAIPFGSAVLLLSQAEPMALRMRPWTTRGDAARLTGQQASVEADILDAARRARP
jgi:type IV secretory pathway TraG/TraD family ATPase VirD4